jgi:hypothetical protein
MDDRGCGRLANRTMDLPYLARSIASQADAGNQRASDLLVGARRIPVGIGRTTRLPSVVRAGAGPLHDFAILGGQLLGPHIEGQLVDCAGEPDGSL